MKLLELTRGYYAMIDDADCTMVDKYQWHARVDRRKDGSIKNVYAAKTVPTGDGRYTAIYLHRFLLGITDPKVKVDHRNHVGLDNQRSNLRTCDIVQNGANARKRSDNTSGVKGVTRGYKGKWVAQIAHRRKTTRIGEYNTPEEAGEAYKSAAKKLFGEFAQ